MVKHFMFTDFYRERIKDNLASLQYLYRDIGEMNRIRESAVEDWEIEELCRHIVFLDAQIIEELRKEIEHDQQRIKEFEGRRSAQGPERV